MAKVLVVDDDVELAGMVEDWLMYEQHNVTVVHTGFEGWSQIQTNEYELAILDWDLPDLNGIDILKRHRAAGGTTPIIMLTGHGTIDDKAEGLDSGANDYVTKPFHMKELSARVRAVLRVTATAAPPAKPLGTGNEAVLEKGNLIGTSLAAKYEFLDVIGEGGVGLVFKARHPHLDRIVAIKMLLPSEMSEEMVARFEREARAISRLNHPNVITVHDFGITEKRMPFMVMEFVEGKALDVVLQEQDYLPLDLGLSLMIQVCDGLVHAHEVGVLHRDIKPSNIMLQRSPDGLPVPKILDFGLAKLRDHGNQKAVVLTQAQQVFGSPPYMSPEQVRGKTLDERSDVYSMACVIFEVVTGYPPHVGDTAMEIMIKHLEEPPFTFQEVRPELTYPPELERTIARALEKDPANRHQTMRELKDDIQRVAAVIGARF
ncbi:MAG TPA: protein kinase [Candidatus Obscuribacterales bacterium]